MITIWILTAITITNTPIDLLPGDAAEAQSDGVCTSVALTRALVSEAVLMRNRL